ncbi:7TM diverse intracellular signaling domain-containing protein [Pedobacter sp. SYP-B3415]|uniref:sensor histidine kinase n=1 Tax=Pedobacter sp. SYP-B3415 TaxID=2496641 RepID=UPI00101DE461|nr:7TM diverse intracellular signaling domain-containing protein [Pedobacter sp. SYP-B3415]
MKNLLSPAPCRFFLLLAFILLTKVCQARQIFILEDPARSMDARQALTVFDQGRFKELRNKNYNAGYTNSVFWLAIKLSGPVAERRWIIGNSHINRIDFYHFKQGILKNHLVTGDHFPFNQRPAPDRQFVFETTDPATYLARIDKHGESLQIFSTLIPAEVYHEDHAVENMLNGIYIGAIVLMILFALFLYITIRDRLYLLYICYIVSSYAWVMANKGYGFQYFWPGFPAFASLARPLFNSLCGVSLLLFMQHFIGQDKNSRLYKLNSGLKIITFILGLLFIAPLIFPSLFKLGTGMLVALQLVIGLILVSTVLSIAEKIKQKNRQAMFFLLSIIVLFFFVLTEFFVHAGVTVISSNFWQNFGMQTGFVFEALILLFGLAFQLNRYRSERERLLLSMNEQQRTLSASIIETQENERRHIADQLHDEVGAQLSVATLQLGTVVENRELDVMNRERLRKAAEVLKDVAHTIRNLSHVLTPVAIDKYGFAKTIEDLAGTINLTRKLEVECIIVGFEADTAIPSPILITLYRISQELLNNTLKHAQAKHALLQLVELEDSITLFYEDDGIGLSEGTDKNGKGLHSIVSRISFYNGQCEILSPPPGGVIVNIEIPLIK